MCEGKESNVRAASKVLKVLRCTQERPLPYSGFREVLVSTLEVLHKISVLQGLVASLNRWQQSSYIRLRKPVIAASKVDFKVAADGCL